MRALVIDDDLGMCEVLHEFLEPFGECGMAVNGSEGIASIQRAMSQGCPYDLICLDIKMPDIDGHEVLKAIRRLEKEKGYVSIDCATVVMVTGAGDFQDVMDAYREECDAYIEKPFSRSRFLEELARLGLIKKEDI